jgi:hypothetical protein
LLFAILAREKDFKEKLATSSKAAKDVETHLAAVEAKCKKDVAAIEARTAKAKKYLAEFKWQQAAREQAIVERVDSLSMVFVSKYICLPQDPLVSLVHMLLAEYRLSCCNRADWGYL